MKLLKNILSILSIFILMIQVCCSGVTDKKKAVILCFDSMDAKITEEMIKKDLLPNIKTLVEKGSYHRIIPETPSVNLVNWASFATGLKPASSAIPDLIVSDKSNYLPRSSDIISEERELSLRSGSVFLVPVFLSLILFPCSYLIMRKMKVNLRKSLLLSLVFTSAICVTVYAGYYYWQPIKEYRIKYTDIGDKFWDVLGKNNISCSVYSLPFMDPSKNNKNNRIISGLGNHRTLNHNFRDITLYSTQTLTYSTDNHEFSTIEKLNGNEDIFIAYIAGPKRDDTLFTRDMESSGLIELAYRQSPDFSDTFVPTYGTHSQLGSYLKISKTNKKDILDLSIQGTSQTVKKGEWSEWFEVEYRYNPFYSKFGIVKFGVVETGDEITLISTGVFTHPLKSEYTSGAPEKHIRDIIAKFGFFSPSSSLYLRNHNFSYELPENMIEKLQIIDSQLREKWLEYELITQSSQLSLHYFSFPRNVYDVILDEEKTKTPLNFRNITQKKAISSYQMADRIIGKTLDLIDENTLLLVVSNGGIQIANKTFDINRWLEMRGFMSLKRHTDKYLAAGLFGFSSVYLIDIVNFERTYAYSLGSGGIYINLRGRESEGIVSPRHYKMMVDIICNEISNYRDPATGIRPVARCYKKYSMGNGRNTPYSYPDIIVTFKSPYRIATHTIFGSFESDEIIESKAYYTPVDLTSDPAEIPGFILSNRKIKNQNNPEIIDVFPSILKYFNIEPAPELKGKTLEFQ